MNNSRLNQAAKKMKAMDWNLMNSVDHSKLVLEGSTDQTAGLLILNARGIQNL
jgi:hypothetical protein